MISTADLDTLLARLRAAGLSIGAEETLRASYLVLQLRETLSDDWLREALRALLVKSASQCGQFDDVFATWAVGLTEREQLDEKAPRQTEIPNPNRGDHDPRPSAPKQRRSVRQWLREHQRKLWVALLLLGLLGFLGERLRDWFQSAASPDAGIPPHPVEDLGTVINRKTLLIFAPTIAVEPSPLPLELWHGAGALLGGLGLGLFLYFRLSGRRYLPLPVASPTRPGPAEILPSVPPSQGRLRLLDLRSQESLVWGIGRFVSEEQTRKLDVPSTVEATVAAAGIPTLRFVRARHQREVWLWIDESATGCDRDYGPLLRQLAHELSTSLRRGGLPVEEALYWGLPSRLSRLLESGHIEGEFAPSEVDERRDAALIVLLTDGRMLADSLSSERFRGETRALLRQLAHFPRLAFCDVSRGIFGLAQLLAEFELGVLLPEQVAKFLGGVPLDPPLVLPTQLSGDLRLWAAACALSPYPLDEETLFWVREQLGLTVEAAASVRLKSLAQPAGDRLQVIGQQRAQLLGWLRLISTVPDGPLSDLRQRLLLTWLGRTLAMWRQRLDQENTQRQARDATVPWFSTPAEQHLRMQKALLDLWDQPVQATEALYALSAGGLREELQQQMSALGPLELSADARLTILPWYEQQLPSLTRGLLRTLHFGGDRPRSTLRAQRPARLYIAWAGCVGLLLTGAIALWQGVWQLRHPHGEPHIRQEHAPKDAQIDLQQKSESEYLITARNQMTATTAPVPAGSDVLVTWEEEERELKDAGAEPPIRVADLSPPMDSATPPDLPTPLDMTAPPDLRPPALPAWSCPYAEYKEPKSEVVFVKVCGGDFKMGSAANDQDAEADEKPAYPVHLDTFWIGKYEVSNAQYRKQKPEHKSTFDGNELPVQDVDWNEARAYCRSIGGDLPTEAEWEYAARGPEGRKYPWGKTEPQPGRATFNRLYSEGPEAITANPRGRGPFGTMNQAGNVWEWVTDCYQDDRYAKRKAQSDKTNPPSAIGNPVDDRSGCDRRVLRGGSFYDVPGCLRSAVRVRYGPEFRDRDLGFRCVRGSGRPP